MCNVDTFDTEGYELSNLGFLSESCHKTLPSNFSFLKDVIEHLPETMSNGRTFRSKIHMLPKYDKSLHSIDGLNINELRYMYSILAMLINRYIWCTGVEDAKCHNIIDSILCIPLYMIGNKFDIVPTLTHAALDLWNWSLSSADHGLINSSVLEPEQIVMNHTFTGNCSEEWFYKIMVAIEGSGHEALRLIPIIHKYFHDSKKTVENLKVLNRVIVNGQRLLRRMYDYCDPDFFFNHLRIYLSGSKNDNLPDGVFFDLRLLGLGMWNTKFTGGSAAQSTLIQVYDAFFGVIHEGHGKEFLDSMMQYMPREHRQYLVMVRGLPSLREYIDTSNDTEVTQQYNECIISLTKFRKEHINLIHGYISKPTKTHDTNAHGTKGSAGTDPVIFCSKIIMDTRNTITHDSSQRRRTFDSIKKNMSGTISSISNLVDTISLKHSFLFGICVLAVIFLWLLF